MRDSERISLAGIFSQCRVVLQDGSSYVGRLEVRGGLRRLWFVATDGSGAEFRADFDTYPPQVASIHDAR